MEFNGWKLCDNIIIVTRENVRKGTQGYIVDPSNKSQLNSAIQWAGKGYGQVEFENSGFQLEIAEAAERSTMSNGKLSFWNCRISKDGKTFLVGINSDLLLKLIKASTIVRGKVKEEVMFVSNNGSIGVLHTGMPEYTEAVKDMEFRKGITKNRTTKWQLGHSYRTLEKSDFYIGDAYDWFEEVEEMVEREVILGYTKVENTTIIRMRKAPIKVHIAFSKFVADSNKGITKVSDILNLLMNSNRYNLKFMRKFPNRVEDNGRIEVDVTTSDLDKLFDSYEQEISTYEKKTNTLVDKLRYTATPVMTSSRLEVLKSLEGGRFLGREIDLQSINNHQLP